MPLKSILKHLAPDQSNTAETSKLMFTLSQDKLYCILLCQNGGKSLSSQI